MASNKPVELSDRELMKFILVLSDKRVKMLYIENKIKLTSKQLDKLIDYGKELK